MYFDDRLVGQYRLVPWNPVGYETTVVTFYVRGTLIFPWWTEVSTSSLFLTALREANDPRAWEQLKILRSLTDALDLGYLKRATEKKGADNFNGGRIWRDSLPNMVGKGKLSWTGSTWLAVELFSIWSSIIFQVTFKKYRTFIYGPCFNHSYVSLSQNLLLYIDTSNVWVCHVCCSCLGYDSFQIPGSLDLRCSNGPKEVGQHQHMEALLKSLASIFL